MGPRCYLCQVCHCYRVPVACFYFFTAFFFRFGARSIFVNHSAVLYKLNNKTIKQNLLPIQGRHVLYYHRLLNYDRHETIKKINSGRKSSESALKKKFFPCISLIFICLRVAGKEAIYYILAFAYFRYTSQTTNQHALDAFEFLLEDCLLNN